MHPHSFLFRQLICWPFSSWLLLSGEYKSVVPKLGAVVVTESHTFGSTVVISQASYYDWPKCSRPKPALSGVCQRPGSCAEEARTGLRAMWVCKD
jgi:hypothetical protein